MNKRQFRISIVGKLILAIAVLFLSAGTFAQSITKPLSIDAIFNPEKRVSFTGSPSFGIRWTDNGDGFVETRFENGGVVIVNVNLKTNTDTVFYSGSKAAGAIKSLGYPPEAAQEIASLFPIAYNDATASFLINNGKDLFIYNAKSNSAHRLTNDATPELEADLSPDGKYASFVSGNDLYIVDTQTAKKFRITRDGNKNILNGYLAWVYEEELYGRGQNRGYWWSPDSKNIAFLRTDDSKVPMFVLADDTVIDQEIEDVGYPKAGDPNPEVILGIASINKLFEVNSVKQTKRKTLLGEIRKRVENAGISIPIATKNNPFVKWVDSSKYAPEDFLISAVDWSPDSQNVIYQAQNREQTFLDLNSIDINASNAKTLFRESTKAWIDSPGNPYWLKDGSFIWRSPVDGWHHLYHYDRDGKLKRRITKGDWEVRQFYGVDQENGYVYFAGTKESPIAQSIYRINLDGSRLQNLTPRAGTHSASFNSEFTHFVNIWSDINTPYQTSLHSADGKLERVINSNPVKELAEYGVSKPEFLKVRNRDGFEMEAYMIKPPNFDPKKKYPVLSFVYGGPHAPQVRNGWSGSQYMYHQYLAQQGYIIWVCDPRSASGKGEKETWTAYKQLGKTEQLDIEDGQSYLKKQTFVDPDRLGIWGWSYGGYMTLYALTHSKTFKAGVSVAPVSDYRLYDSIYTERFMLTPQNNPEGYADTNLNANVKDLHGKLLLVHGIMDNNVHFQNTTKFVHEAQKAGVQFDFMAYPKQRHGISNPSQKYHLYTMMSDFILRNL